MKKTEKPTYHYKGYTFRATHVLHANTMRPLYEIDGLKELGKRPFLTTIKQCREYIDNVRENSF